YAANYSEALPLLKSSLAQKSDVARVHILIAFVLAKLNRIDEASEFLKSAAQLDAEDERIQRVEAVILTSQGRFEEALASLSRYALDHPDDTWDVWNDLGMLYYQQEQYQQAEDSFRQAIKSAGAMGLVIPFVHFNLALCFNAVGRYSDAKEQLSIALEEDSELASAWSVLGLLVAVDEDYERAIEYIERAIDLQPENPSHWFAMAQVMEIYGDQSAAQHYFEEGYKAAQNIQALREIPDSM
ncbi:hypothetical protein DRQ26_05515, partial [bacterium]